MGRFIIRRVFSMIVVLVAISILTFLIFQAIPNGDPAERMAGRLATPENVQAIREDWGFDKPLYVQYLRMMKLIFTGKVVSYTQQVNVVDQIRQGLPATLSLAIGAALIWLFLGIVVGVISAVTAGRFTDRFVTVLALIGVSTPVFFLGAVLLYLLGFKAGIFPIGDYVGLTENPWEWLKHLILPWAALSVLFIGVYSRVLRSTMLDTMHEDFVRMARAKGLTERQVLRRHVLRNSLIPVISLWGLDFAAVIGGGAILTESVFNLQGVGQYLAQSTQALDVPPVIVITLFLSFFVVVLSAITDVIYAILDPRIRLSG
jgi:peptide/nickel transport system permease protein